MRLLHQELAKYWLLARMCNDVIVHASTSGFFLYLSPECKEALGYNPNGLSDAALHQIIHPDDLRTMKCLCTDRERPGGAHHEDEPLRSSEIASRPSEIASPNESHFSSVHSSVHSSPTEGEERQRRAATDPDSDSNPEP